MEERVQKFLSRSGAASRRQAEQMMLEGRVTVNGTVVRELGVKLDPDKDAVKVDGKRVHGETPAYVLLYKPKGTICTLDDPEQRPTVMELVRGVKARLFPVGRLDFDTTGALLLTNDGEMANLLMHPRHRFSKTYLAKVKGIPTEERLEKLRRGVNIEGVRTAPAEARIVSVKEKNSLVEVVLREGRNRQVKRMFLEIGHPVIRLHRSAYAFLTLDGLLPTQWRHLMPEEVKRLQSAAARANAPAGDDDEDGFRPRLARPIKAPREFAPRAVDGRPAAASAAGAPARERKPGGYERKPGGYERKPGGYERKPGGYERKPGGYERKPGGYQGKSASTDGKPGGYERKPGGYERKPGGYERKPGGYERKPGGYERKPGGYQGRAVSTDGKPGGYERKPGGYQGKSDSAGSKPGGYERKPSGYTLKPSGTGRRTVLPPRRSSGPAVRRPPAEGPDKGDKE